MSDDSEQFDLRDKQRAVLDTILREPGLSNGQAYQKTYKGASASSARSNVWKLLKNPEAQRYLAHRRERLARITEIEDADVMRKFSDVAFAKMTDFMRWGQDGVELFSSDTLSAGQAAGVAEVKEVKTKNATTVSIKLHNKIAALENLARMKGMYQDRSELKITGIDSLLEEIAESKQRSTVGQIEDRAGKKTVH